MKIREVTKALEKLAPGALQQPYDNAGLIIGSGQEDVTGVLICLDVTEDVLFEAEERNCNLVVAHHPMIFKPVRQIIGKTMTERLIIHSIKKNIAVYASHTNLDAVINGVNGKIASLLGLTSISVLQPQSGLLRKLVTFCPEEHADVVRNALFEAGAGRIGNYDNCSYNIEGLGSFRALNNTNPYVGKKGSLHFEKEIRIETIFPQYLEKDIIEALLASHPYEEVAYDVYRLENNFCHAGMGLIGELENPMKEGDFLTLLKEKFQTDCIRHTKLSGKYITSVAVCGGSGSFLIEEAMAAKAEVFVTADVKYHDFFEVDGSMLIADIGHYESEQFTKELICEFLKKKFSNFALLISEVNTNPVQYF